MEIWIPIIISILTLLWSVVQLHKQQKLANQHRLWDKRMQQYRVLQSIMHTYKENRFLLWSHNKVQQDIAEAADQLYGWISNCDVIRAQLTQQIQTPEHQHIAIQDFLHDCVEQTKVLWDVPISNVASQMIAAYMNLLHGLYQQAKFNQCENETATKWHIPLHVIQQRKYTQAEDGKVYQSVQECEIAYNNCTQDNVLHHMKNALTLSSISPLARIKSWLKSKQSKSKPSLHKPDEMLVEHQKSVIDIHDKRLSQLFKVCYIAAPGFASALLAHSTLMSNSDTVAKYTIPAIITATAAVVLWIIKYALRAGQCYAYSAESWQNTIEHANRTYQYALAMIKCALTWIIVVFLVSVISLHYERLTSFIQWLGDTFTPTENLCILSGIMILRCAINRGTSNAKIQSICTQITYYVGLLWTTQVIWNL